MGKIIAVLLVATPAAASEECAAERAEAEQLQAALTSTSEQQRAATGLSATDVRRAQERVADCERKVAANAKEAADRRAAKEREQRVEKEALDPKWQREIISARTCFRQERRKGALDEITKEKKYSKLGGVVDLAKMKDLQDQVRLSDEGIEADRANAKHLKLGALLSCDVPRVKALVGCYYVRETPDAEACSGEPARELLDVDRVLFPPQE